jgi:hypothetical protein
MVGVIYDVMVAALYVTSDKHEEKLLLWQLISLVIRQIVLMLSVRFMKRENAFKMACFSYLV